ncbi:putative lysine-specific demethylase 4B [Nymphon striatum]|nr:putative lysine-specific demethylase 4B [Nymphon striatum]
MTEESNMNHPTIMVFRPSEEEFKDFSTYVHFMETKGAMRAGVAKIIPPASWKPRLKGYDDIDDLVIPAPITQQIDGRGGVYNQYNIVKKPVTLKDFREMAESTIYRTPYHEDYDDLDRKYWKNITYNQPMYGADVSGSLYDPDVKEFNINNLNTCLDAIGEDYGIKIEGVNTAYLYFGMWKTTFPWHTEDMDLYSINFLHYGAPKSWCAIPPEHGRRFERVAENYYADQKQSCSAFLRHKMSILSPQVLKSYSIPYNKITQEAGEFIITFPYGYHSGYNHGYNCAESTNFALERWIEYGKRCSQCTCRNDSVKINMEVFVKRFQPDRYGLWLKGEDIASHPEDPSRVVSAGPLGKAKATKKKKTIKPPLKRHPHHKKASVNSNDTPDCSKITSDGCETTVPGKTCNLAKKSVKRKDNCTSGPNKKQKSAQPTKSKKKLKIVEKKQESLPSSIVGISSPFDDDTRNDGIPIASENELISVTVSSETSNSSLQSHVSQLNISSPYAGQIIPSLISTNDSFEIKTLYIENLPITVRVSKSSNSVSPTSMMLSQTSTQNGNHLPEYLLPIPPTVSNISANTQPNSTLSPSVPAANMNINSAAATLLELSQQVNQSPNSSVFYHGNHDQNSVGVITSSSEKDEVLKNELSQQLSINESNCDNYTSEECKVSSEKTSFVNKKEGRLDVKISHMNEAWHQILRHMWQYLPKIALAEKEYNRWMSLVKPHCVVCMIFKPFVDVISRKDAFPKVPEASNLEIPISYYEQLCGSISSMDYDGPRTLLICSDCGICVHDCCYGVSSASMLWKCDGCSSEESISECCACNLRGGALKATSDGKWIHVICALILPGANFKNNSLLVDCNINVARKNLKCVFCGNKSIGRESACAQCSKGKCTQSFHVTCGYAAGVTFKKNDGPELFSAFCLKHSETKPKLTERKKMFPIIVFDDGSQSEDLYPEDIVSHNCVKFGPPEENARVSVKWTDSNIYEGIFIDSSSCVMCHVKFEDGSAAKVKRQNVYVEGEKMPKKVSSRLSSATEGRHTDLFDESKQAEGKRIRHANSKYSFEESNLSFVNNNH